MNEGMSLSITGDMRDVANSAWISTLSEISMNKRTDADVDRVVSFLAKEHHTSPFESCTITVSLGGYNTDPSSDLGYYALAQNHYARVHNKPWYVTIDLLNFMKVMILEGHYKNSRVWDLFVAEREKLADVSFQFGEIKPEFMQDVSPLLGDHGMSVELISLHNPYPDDRSSARATWRLKLPLSISVQLLRHRKSSPNMVSGRYRTIFQDMVGPATDVSDISNKFGFDYQEYLKVVDPVIERYEQYMKEAKVARDSGLITNPEYKRLREAARFVLPEGRLTEMFETQYLDDFYDNFLLLRDSKHAQTEHVWIAQEMRRVLESVYGKV